MDQLTMMAAESWLMFVTLTACIAGGVVLGLAYFWTIRRTADKVTGRLKGRGLIGLSIGRLVLLTSGFLLVFQLGSAAVLALLWGVLVGRNIVLRRVGSHVDVLTT